MTEIENIDSLKNDEDVNADDSDEVEEAENL